MLLHAQYWIKLSKRASASVIRAKLNVGAMSQYPDLGQDEISGATPYVIPSKDLCIVLPHLPAS